MRVAGSPAREPAIDIVIESDRWKAVPQAATIVRRAVIEAAGSVAARTAGRTLAVLLTDDAAMRRLNAQWRGRDTPTNVLSFPSAPRPGAGGSAPLGDIAIGYETVTREAQDAGKPVDDHLAHLAVHGFLHLLGYDHESDAQAHTMEELERVILRSLGVPDPYPTQETGV
jgi:probable rRNA maturation factor